MSPEEAIGKFVSFELMIKGSKKIIEQGAISTLEVQPVAFCHTRALRNKAGCISYMRQRRQHI
jgi:hypothetical protein